jgi:DNA-binding MarR family transcriptional regulator
MGTGCPFPGGTFGKDPDRPDTIAGIVDRLENKGLVERQPHPADGRAYQVMITARGRGFEKELCDAANRARDRLSTRILPGEYKTLARLLKKLRE